MSVMETASGLDGQVLVLTMSNPPVNALSAGLRADLISAFDRVNTPESRVRTIILRGANQRFSAGGDIRELELTSVEGNMRLHESFASLFHAVRTCSIPVIAAIEGYAMGGGLELSLCCDLRYVTPETHLAASGVNMGLIESAHTLGDVVPRSYAAELLFTGNTIDGSEAARIGVATRCVPGHAFERYVADIATRIASRAPASVQATKQVLASSRDTPGEAAALSAQLWLRLRTTRDHKEALRAFRERRPPLF